MARTLFTKLAISLVVLLLIHALISYFLMQYTFFSYEKERLQYKYKDLAKTFLNQYPLMDNNILSLSDKIHYIPQYYPNIEAYILDTSGLVLATTCETLTKDRIMLSSIEKFANDNTTYPLYAEDPAYDNDNTVFSAAAIKVDSHEDVLGYLYLVLKKDVKNIEQSFDMSNSYTMQQAVLFMVVCTILAIIAALLIVKGLVARLNRLTNDIELYRKNELPAVDQTKVILAQDEVDILTQTFQIMAKRLDKQIDQLKQADTLRREMVANISHDLRTPVAALCSVLETLHLKSNTMQTEEIKKYLQVALQQSRRLARLVKELFDLSKLEACDFKIQTQTFPLAELVHDIIQKFKTKAIKNKVQLQIEMTNHPHWVEADIELIERVLDNLLENALRHTQPYGYIKVYLTKQDNAVYVQVEDTGCGIAEQEIPHIFERFYRGKQSYSNDPNGTGLGLAIVKRILELHNSQIKVTSQLGKGACFAFSLPTQIN